MIHTIQEFSRKRFSSTSTISPTEAGYWYVQALRAEMETMGKQWERKGNGVVKVKVYLSGV